MCWKKDNYEGCNIIQQKHDNNIPFTNATIDVFVILYKILYNKLFVAIVEGEKAYEPKKIINA